MLTNKKISIVVTCYLDELAIPVMYERVKKTLSKITGDWELIYVNDGSPDNSELVLADLAKRDKRVTVINHSRNFSSQNAFVSGMEQSLGDAVVLLDGDLQDPPELIENFVKKWLEGYDVVYGVREKREAPVLMQIAYKLFYKMFQKLSYVKMPKDAGDFSLMDRKVVEIILSMPERDIFLRGLRAWVGFKQTGVRYHRPKRAFGNTTNNLRKNIRWAKKGIFSFSYLPLEYIFYLGVLVVLFSFLAIVFYIFSYIFSWLPRGSRGIQTIIVLILFLGGLQLLSISIIGEYQAKIFEETKKRPKYIIKNILNDHKKDKK